jgi:hypothetical protein
MNMSFSRKVLLTIVAVVVALLVETTAAAPNPPNPVLAFLGQEYATVGGKKMTRYYFDIANKDEYPVELFEASPTLPPCGTTKNASRTWLDIYDQNGKRLNGFCAIMRPADLTKLWFQMDLEEVPPSWVYIEFTDRKTNTKYKSNLAETTL